MMNRALRSVRIGLVVFVLLVAYFQLQSPTRKMYKKYRAMHHTVTTRLEYPHFQPLSVARRPSLGYNHMETLNAKLVPKKSKYSEDQRLIVIGDVHGAWDELKELVKKIAELHPNTKKHYVFTGDLVSKGPCSLEVVEMANQLNASCVRGNQDDRLLLLYHQHQRDHNNQFPLDIKDEVGGMKVNPTKELKPDAKRKPSELAKIMQEQHVKYLESCPLILKLDEVGGIGNVAIVHAGVVPGVPFEDQDPSTLMTIRTIDESTHIPSPDRNKGTHWTSIYNYYTRKHARKGVRPTTIIYGHDARRGLDIQEFSKGLDSNCVRGGRLSALVIQGGKRPRNSVVSVKCKSYLLE